MVCRTYLNYCSIFKSWFFYWIHKEHTYYIRKKTLKLQSAYIVFKRYLNKTFSHRFEKSVQELRKTHNFLFSQRYASLMICPNWEGRSLEVMEIVWKENGVIRKRGTWIRVLRCVYFIHVYRIFKNIMSKFWRRLHENISINMDPNILSLKIQLYSFMSKSAKHEVFTSNALFPSRFCLFEPF